MRADLLTLYVYLAGIAVVLALVLSAIVKLLAKPLAFYQAFLVSLVAAATAIALYVFYTLSKPLIGVAHASPADSLVIIVMMCAMGTIITRMLRRYGIEKTGWLGVGAKSMLWFLVLAWIFAGTAFLMTYLGQRV